MADDPPKYRGGCTPGMRVGTDTTPGCRRGCLHRALVQEYRDSRHAWEERRENGHHMQMEDDDYRAAYPPPTFRAWLEGLAGRNQEDSTPCAPPA